MSDDTKNDEVEAERNEESADVEGHRRPRGLNEDADDDDGESDVEGHRFR